LYSSPSTIIRMIKSRSRKGNTHGKEEECTYDIGGKARRKETTKEDQDVGGWTLKWILER
jgi:hypothetical protein